ncbi:hypothetical protein RRG08_009052 [Elysia crispata]|uniref:Uncharacterized protein n=1 Tax=Elysia crispata TaxID=231223 RepID=A0AAE1ACN1_9GAST|nr:hypothetical protein RRG08_009052 [Elysia crispata]
MCCRIDSPDKAKTVHKRVKRLVSVSPVPASHKQFRHEFQRQGGALLGSATDAPGIMVSHFIAIQALVETVQRNWPSGWLASETKLNRLLLSSLVVAAALHHRLPLGKLSGQRQQRHGLLQMQINASVS